MAVVSDECVTLMTSSLRSKVIKEGVWTHQEPENRAEALSVPHLCPGSQRQGFAWNPWSSLPWGSCVPTAPSEEMVLSDLGSSVASQAEGHTHILGSPCS